MKRFVSVLMATYNSEKYMRQQIDSILAQEGVEVMLLVRDDGSTDCTHVILDEYADAGKLKWYTGKNLRSAHCFMQLLRDAPKADFYAFADHDDYWQKDKLKIAVEKLEDSIDKPALYLSQPQSADNNLQPLLTKQFAPIGGFGESLIYWFAMGCTMVMTNDLKDIVNTYNPEYMHMHDVWVYSIAYAVGAKVVWDTVPHTLNRQHGGNVVGLNTNPIAMARLRMQRLFEGKESRYHQAYDIQKGFEKYLTTENKIMLNDFVASKYSFIKRISMVFDKRFRCSDKATQMLFWINLLLNKH